MAKVTEPCRGRADPGPFFGLWGLEFRPCLSGLFERKPCFRQPWVRLPGHSAIRCGARRCSDTPVPIPKPSMG